MQTRFRQAARGMRLLFAAQIVALMAIIPNDVIQIVTVLAALALILWGLKTAAPAQRGYRLAFRTAWLWMGLLLLPVGLILLIELLPEAAALPLAYLYMACDPLAELAWYAVQALILYATARVLREAGEESRARSADLCWKLLVALAGASVLLGLLLVIFSAVGGRLSNLLSGGALAALAPLGLGLMVMSIIYMVLLYRSYGSLQELADRMDRAAAAAEAGELQPPVSEDPWDRPEAD